MLLPGVVLKGLPGAPRQLDSDISEINEHRRGFQADQLDNMRVVVALSGCTRADVGMALGEGVEG